MQIFGRDVSFGQLYQLYAMGDEFKAMVDDFMKVWRRHKPTVLKAMKILDIHPSLAAFVDEAHATHVEHKPIPKQIVLDMEGTAIQNDRMSQVF